MTDAGTAGPGAGDRPAAPSGAATSSLAPSGVATSRPAEELLYDSEAALRLVRTALLELNGAVPDSAGDTAEEAIPGASSAAAVEQGSPGEARDEPTRG